MWSDLIKAAIAHNDAQLASQLLKMIFEASKNIMPDETDLDTLDSEAKVWLPFWMVDSLSHLKYT